MTIEKMMPVSGTACSLIVGLLLPTARHGDRTHHLGHELEDLGAELERHDHDKEVCGVDEPALEDDAHDWGEARLVRLRVERILQPTVDRPDTIGQQR